MEAEQVLFYFDGDVERAGAGQYDELSVGLVEFEVPMTHQSATVWKHWDKSELETYFAESYRLIVLNFWGVIDSYEIYYICSHICKGIFGPFKVHSGMLLPLGNIELMLNTPDNINNNWSHRNNNIQREYVEGEERRARDGESSNINV